VKRSTAVQPRSVRPHRYVLWAE